MTAEPKVGWLLSYSYLWADDHVVSDEEGLRIGPVRLLRPSAGKASASMPSWSQSPTARRPTVRRRSRSRQAQKPVSDSTTSDRGSFAARRISSPGRVQTSGAGTVAGEHLVRPAAAEACGRRSGEAPRMRQGRRGAARAAQRVTLPVSRAARSPEGEGFAFRRQRFLSP
jgi:hypothetical protein